MTEQAIAERYGRTAASRRRAVVLGVVAAAGVVVVAVAWVVWAGLFGPAASLESRDLGYSKVGAESVDVDFEVTTDPGTTVSCALQALNEKFAIVGWRIVDLPASDERTRRFTENVRVTEPAVTGLIYRCWLT